MIAMALGVLALMLIIVLSFLLKDTKKPKAKNISIKLSEEEIESKTLKSLLKKVEKYERQLPKMWNCFITKSKNKTKLIFEK